MLLGINGRKAGCETCLRSLRRARDIEPLLSAILNLSLVVYHHIETTLALYAYPRSSLASCLHSFAIQYIAKVEIPEGSLISVKII